MALSTLQRLTVLAIVCVHETGSVQGDYTSAIIVTGDLGGLTYGKAQTTLNGGNLYKLVSRYCQWKGADGRAGEFAVRLAEYLPQIKRIDKSLNDKSREDTQRLLRLLRLAGATQPMQQVQDSFFDAVYFQPALAEAAREGITSPLGIAVVYDSFIHGSWQLIERRVDQGFGDVTRIGEKAWIKRYVQLRREWLSKHSNLLLRKTVYRMDTFNALIAAGNWTLALPFTVHGTGLTKNNVGG